jgi:hypothetical protein
MNLRHAAALALVGWYLMTPPPSSKENWSRVTPPVPLGRWIMRDGFDTADACRKARDDLKSKSDNASLDDYQRWLAGRSASDHLRDEWAAQYSLFAAIQDANGRALCIATDDPRLKEK